MAMAATDASFIRDCVAKLNRPFTVPKMGESIPEHVLASSLSQVSASLATARKPKLAPSVAAFVVEQVTACREERVLARRKKQARMRSRGRLRIPAEGQRETWWDDLPEEWVADEGEEIDAELAGRYVDALQRLRTLSAKRAKLRHQVAHYERLNDLLSRVDPVTLSTMIPTDDASALASQLERTRKTVEKGVKRRRTRSPPSRPAPRSTNAVLDELLAP